MGFLGVGPVGIRRGVQVQGLHRVEGLGVGVLRKITFKSMLGLY